MLALGRLSAIIPTLPNPDLLTEPFMRREAVLSSKIEGTKTDVGQLYLFETGEKQRIKSTLEDDDVGDAREVLNYVVALRHGLDSLKRMPICNRLLRDLHRILMDGVPDERGKYKSPGKFRDRQAYVGSGGIQTARYVAPPATNVPALMGQLERYINLDQKTLPRLVKIALVHYQFEAIHPFHDGNGRLGRLLVSLLLAAMRILDQPLLYLSAFLARHKEEYVSRLWDVSRCGAWKNWASFFLRGIIEVSDDAVKRARSLMALREEYRGKFQSQRQTGASILMLVDHLFHWPVVTVSDAAEKLGMTYQGALKNVEKLKSLKLLEELPARKRNKLYVAAEIIKVLE